MDIDIDFLPRENLIARKIQKPMRRTPLHPGARTDAAGKAVDNVILLSLPDREYNLLRPHLEPAELPQYEILLEP